MFSWLLDRWYCDFAVFRVKPLRRRATTGWAHPTHPAEADMSENFSDQKNFVVGFHGSFLMCYGSGTVRNVVLANAAAFSFLLESGAV